MLSVEQQPKRTLLIVWETCNTKVTARTRVSTFECTASDTGKLYITDLYLHAEYINGRLMVLFCRKPIFPSHTTTSQILIYLASPKYGWIGIHQFQPSFYQKFPLKFLFRWIICQDHPTTIMPSCSKLSVTVDTANHDQFLHSAEVCTLSPLDSTRRLRHSLSEEVASTLW